MEEVGFNPRSSDFLISSLSYLACCRWEASTSVELKFFLWSFHLLVLVLLWGAIENKSQFLFLMQPEVLKGSYCAPWVFSRSNISSSFHHPSLTPSLIQKAFIGCLQCVWCRRHRDEREADGRKHTPVTVQRSLQLSPFLSKALPLSPAQSPPQKVHFLLSPGARGVFSRLLQ